MKTTVNLKENKNNLCDSSKPSKKQKQKNRHVYEPLSTFLTSSDQIFKLGNIFQCLQKEKRKNHFLNRMRVCVGSVIAECQPLPVFQQIQKIGSAAAVYFWMFKQRWSTLHLCLSGVEEQPGCGFFFFFLHSERKRAALGQEAQADFPGGKPCSPVIDLQRREEKKTTQ